MKSIEEMKAEQAAALVKLEKEHALAALCPVPPKSVQITSGTLGHWVSYEAESLWDAIDLMDKFPVIAFRRFKKSFTRLVPEPLNIGRDAGEEVGGPFVAKIDVSQGEGFGPTVYLAFFFYAGGNTANDICMARVELRKGYHSTGGRYGAAFVRDSHRGTGRRMGARDQYERGEWRANNILASMADSYVKWGTGDDKSAHFTYAIAADYAAADYSAEWSTHGRPMLENIANAMHGARPEVTSC